MEYSISKDSGFPEYEKWYLDRGPSEEPMLHRNARPAVTVFDPSNGNVLYEEYYERGEKVSTYRPASLPDNTPC